MEIQENNTRDRSRIEPKPPEFNIDIYAGRGDLVAMIMAAVKWIGGEDERRGWSYNDGYTKGLNEAHDARSETEEEIWMQAEAHADEQMQRERDSLKKDYARKIELRSAYIKELEGHISELEEELDFNKDELDAELDARWNAGYEAGKKTGWANAEINMGKERTRTEALHHNELEAEYERGFDDGYDKASTEMADKVPAAFRNGFDEGWADGTSKGRDDAEKYYQLKLEEKMCSEYTKGVDDGYADGLAHGTKELKARTGTAFDNGVYIGRERVIKLVKAACAAAEVNADA